MQENRNEFHNFLKELNNYMRVENPAQKTKYLRALYCNKILPSKLNFKYIIKILAILQKYRKYPKLSILTDHRIRSQLPI